LPSGGVSAYRLNFEGWASGRGASLILTIAGRWMRAPGGPRLLLRRLREVMAEPITAQARLDRIVVLIASNMVAEVCSLYVARADGPLELFATEGLNREAVHLTTMRPGEGLVGLIAATAEPLALSDAQNHPSFSYKPETGEEIYQSFLGVPVLRGGATLGVLVVQNRARRSYSDEEIEALQTTAMLLAEMIASGELQAMAGQPSAVAVRKTAAFKGAPIAEGLGLGHAVLHQPRVVISKIVADDVNSELARLETAIQAMRASVDALIDSSDDAGEGEHRDVLEAFRMIAHDRGWLRRLREAVQSGLTAEAAVERVQSDARAKLQRQTDPYLRDRLHDLTDIANRLLHQLAGQSLVLQPDELPDNAILVARSMSPAALLDYDRTRLRGLVLEEAGAASHIAIVARALGVPAVSDLPNISEIVEHGDALIVDGLTGEVHVLPPPEVEAAYSEKARLRARRQDQYRALRDTPAQTLDGVAIGLHMNAGLLIDMPHLTETGAQSIGLFRTELQFMLAARFPRLDSQETLYRAVLDAAGERTVTFRTLDIGGDKRLPYMKALEEENPALGWRAVRIGLDKPALLRIQMRAMLRAAAGRRLRLMLPMVATVDEFRRGRALFERELAFLAQMGREPPTSAELGAMVEAPSLLWQLDEIAAHADFLSVGSNDLLQYFFAADRNNKRVADRFDTLSPAFLRALKRIAEIETKPVAVCGEMGGRPLEAMTLIALGFRHLSMSATAIGPIKAMILSLPLEGVRADLANLIESCGDCATLREPLREIAERHGVRL
jgi:phosphotransferase system enzyme I (PtsP)